MGTRSLVDVNSRFDKNDEWDTITTIYRQSDGYPSGLGEDIKKVLEGKDVVNGYSKPDTQLNGGGCVAAYLVGALKDGRCGNVYLCKPGARERGEEYIYELFIEADQPVLMRVTDAYSGVLFNGLLNDFDSESVESEE